MEAWRAKLDEGDSDAAWDLFIEQYRRLIFATISQLAHDHDDILDVFARVCEALRTDDLARLRRYTDYSGQRARFSTWLVAVVRNQTIDWIRQRDGRPRLPPPPELSPLQVQIFEHIVSGRSHVETYEIIRSRATAPLSFGVFLKELNKTYHAIGAAHRIVARPQAAAGTAILENLASESAEDHQVNDTRRRIAEALETLSPADRLAVQLFIVDGTTAADVARILGWANAKAVYNRIYRALAALRNEFEKRGVRREDL